MNTTDPSSPPRDRPSSWRSFRRGDSNSRDYLRGSSTCANGVAGRQDGGREQSESIGTGAQPTVEALELQRPSADDVMRIVMRADKGEKEKAHAIAAQRCA